MSKSIIIADTTCLILLDKIGYLEILRDLFNQITITSIVAKEFQKPIPSWILIEDPTPTSQFRSLKLIVDEGEASSIALALEKTDLLLIIDDLAGRKLATYFNISLTGTLGVLKMAKNKGIIDDLVLIISEIQKTNFRISDKLIKALLEE